jgi:TolB protein
MLVTNLGRTDLANAPARLTPSPTPTPAPISNGSLPVVSPDGKRIAFVSDRNGADDAYVISVDGRNERQLTATPDAEGNVAWTHDGKILFTVFKDGFSHLFSIDADGKNQRELAKVPGRGVTLSPDAERLLYMAGTWMASKLTISAPDGSNPKEITDGSSVAWNSHWSPDGKQIAFTSRNDPKGELAVFVMNADGSARRQVTHVPPEEGGAQWPVWSPNGRQLAVQANSRTQKGSAHIWIVDVQTGEAHKLAAHMESYLDETPSWFPDGKRIAFQSNRTGKMEVWVMNADGSGAKQVTGLK